MSLSQNTQTRFDEFAAHMREQTLGGGNFPPSRLNIYQRLFSNNVQSLLRQSFPVASLMLDASAAKYSNPQNFKQLVAEFYRTHRCETPRFTEFAPELIQFVEGEIAWHHPWPKQALIELLHYEWLETELMLSASKLADRPSDALAPNQRIMLSPLARPLAYHFPVMRLSAENLPSAESGEPTLLLLWRNRAHSVQFQIVSLGALQLALRLQQSPMSVSELAPDALNLVQMWVKRECVVTCE
jgi:uncharacterized protein